MQTRQPKQARRRLAVFAGLMLALLLIASCNGDDDDAVLSTPNVNVLAPTATSLVARVEVMVVVVTPTAAPNQSTAEGQTQQSGEQQSGEQQSQQQPQAQQQQDQTQQTQQSGQMSNQQLINMGEQVYVANCATCHGEGGEGDSLYPALNNSGLLTLGDPSQAVNIVLHGRGEMPAFADTLSTQQIAAVISYERNAWNNNASVVTLEQVRQVRQGGGAAASAPSDDGNQQSNDQGAATGSDSAAQATPQETSTQETSTQETSTQETSTQETSTQDASAQAQPTPTPAQQQAEQAEAPAATPAETAAAVGEQATATPQTETDEAEQPADAPAVAEAGPTWTPALEVTPLLPSTADATMTPSAAQAETPAEGETTGTPSDQQAGAQQAADAEPPLRWTPARMVTPLLPSTLGNNGASGEQAQTSTPTPSSDDAEETPSAQETSAATPTPGQETAAEDSNGAQDKIAQGEEIYSAECARCHQPDGEGSSLYPSLEESETLTAADPSAAIDIVINGMGQMPGFDGLLSDEEIAAVLTYERNSWGNNAEEITAEQVQSVRETGRVQSNE